MNPSPDAPRTTQPDPTLREIIAEDLATELAADVCTFPKENPFLAAPVVQPIPPLF